MKIPSHKIHIGIGQEIAKKFRLDKNLLLLGSILPDLGKSHYVSHFKISHRNYDIASFIYYRFDSADPVMVGYLVHLLTDMFYNEYVRDNKYVFDDNHKLNGIKTRNGIFYGTPREVCDKKQEGFYDYEYYLLNNNKIEELKMVDLDKLPNIKECDYDKSDIKKYIEIHNNNIKNNKNEPKYEIFSFEELDDLYKSTLEKTNNFLKNIIRVENKRKMYYNYSIDREGK